MKKTFIKITALMLALLTITAGGSGVYADNGIMPRYSLTYTYAFDLNVSGTSAYFMCNFSANPALFDHAELEMSLQRKGLIFWGDVDILISEIWFYESTTNKQLCQTIPDQTGKYRAIYTLRVVGTNGVTDTISKTVEYTYN